MKLVLAARGELGLPGFPAPARPGVDPAMAQLGNAALGVVGALLALMVTRRWRRPVQLGLAAAVGAAAALETFGAAVLVARVFGIADGFGTLPPGLGPTLGAAYAVMTASLFIMTTWFTATGTGADR